MKFQDIKKFIYDKIFWYKIIKQPKLWVIKPEDKILILAPHPDDESIGCGGLIALYPKQCDIICMTDGRHCYSDLKPSEVIEIRKKEFEDVMTKSGVNSFQMLGIEDGRLSKAKPKLNLEKYDYILIPSPTDAHQDHMAVSKILKKYYKKYYKKAVYYEIWSTILRPTHFLDISSVAEQKNSNINLYTSQVKYFDYADKILGLNSYRGMRLHIDYAEAYQFANKKG